MHDARAVVVGCGALGTVIASTIVRAGVGMVRIVDRDFIEESNLQRQTLFDEDDVRRGLPKAVAAAEKLRRVNSEVVIEEVVADVNPANVVDLIAGMDLVLDGTDNFGTRYLVNDACVSKDIPWVYGAVLGTHGLCMAILPHQTPCFRCFMRDQPAAGTVQTCDTAGVLGAAVNVVASLEVVEGLKILLGHREDLFGGLLSVDVWNGQMDLMRMPDRDPSCPACGQGKFEFLQARLGTYVSTLCGRNAVQVNHRGRARVDLHALARRLAAAGTVVDNEYLLRLTLPAHELTVFPDGRAIIKGTDDEAVARSIYDRYVGS